MNSVLTTNANIADMATLLKLKNRGPRARGRGERIPLIYPNLTLVFSFSGIDIPHWYPRCKNKMRTDRQLMFGKRRLLQLAGDKIISAYCKAL